MSNDELLELLSGALGQSAKALADRAASGEITAAEIGVLAKMFRDAGGTLQSSQGQMTTAGDQVLEGMADLDEEFLKGLAN